jgi:hypothetical protein
MNDYTEKQGQCKPNNSIVFLKTSCYTKAARRCFMFGNENGKPADKRSIPMTTAAVVLSVIAVSTICCIYVSFLCGILGIIFALLSKGGESTMSPNARTALIVSVFAVVMTVLLLAASVFTLILQYGSLEAFWNVYMEMVKAYSAGMP